VAEECGVRGIAVLMTGMGEDGARGMSDLKAAGGLTLAQSEESCVVYGMPKAAIERGAACRVVALESLAEVLIAECGAGRKSEIAPSPARLAAGSGKN
jgi:two-component system chemotaxis response regulator CheB